MPPKQPEKNGNFVSWKWIVTVLLGICGALAVGYGSYLKGAVSENSHNITNHAEKEGHPVAMERLHTLQEDVVEIKMEQRVIKTGVQELLRRIPE